MIPTPEEQVQFLRNIQRLLAEGLFVASYKFALLHALADLAVEKGDDSGLPLDLTTKEIAEKYIDLYWRQCRQYQIGGTNTELVLHQNKGSQAAIVSNIARVQQQYGGSLFRFKQVEPKEWSRLLSAVNQVASDDPLHRLQKVGEEYLCFLYDIIEGDRRIRLKPGVGYCLRAFHPLLRDLIRGRWIRWVQEVNANKLGNITDLGTFLFGQERTHLEAYRPILLDIQGGKCLYCHKPIQPRQSHVDHFIPWSRYPVDIGHNFVLAHNGCNAAKSDYLAAENHLAAWAERNRQNQDELRTRLEKAALPCDWAASTRIAQWAYEQTEKASGQVWVLEKVLHHLGPTWRQCFAA